MSQTFHLASLIEDGLNDLLDHRVESRKITSRYLISLHSVDVTDPFGPNGQD